MRSHVIVSRVASVQEDMHAQTEKRQRGFTRQRMVLQEPREAGKHGDQRRKERQVTEQSYNAKGDCSVGGEQD